MTDTITTNNINLTKVGELLIIETKGYINRQHVLNILKVNNIPRTLLKNGDIHIAVKYEALIHLYI